MLPLGTTALENIGQKFCFANLEPPMGLEPRIKSSAPLNRHCRGKQSKLHASFTKYLCVESGACGSEKAGTAKTLTFGLVQKGKYEED
jgi:hypothetical protein